MKVFALMLIVLVGGFAFAQNTVQEWGYIVYDSGGSPAFELEPMGGGKFVPLSGLAPSASIKSEHWYRSPATTTATRRWLKSYLWNLT